MAVRPSAPARRRDAPARRASREERETSAAGETVLDHARRHRRARADIARSIAPGSFQRADRWLLCTHRQSARTRQFSARTGGLDRWEINPASPRDADQIPAALRVGRDFALQNLRSQKKPLTDRTACADPDQDFPP